jgi:hypothetical protein
MSFDADPVSGEARLNAKGAACPLLASQTMTHGNAYGIPHDIERELPTAAVGLASGHARYSEAS